MTQANRFLQVLTPGHEGRPLLSLERDERGGLLVSGAWEDPLGTPVIIFEHNRTVWSLLPAIRLTVEQGGTELMMDGEVVWRAACDGEHDPQPDEDGQIDQDRARRHLPRRNCQVHHRGEPRCGRCAARWRDATE